MVEVERQRLVNTDRCAKSSPLHFKLFLLFTLHSRPHRRSPSFEMLCCVSKQEEGPSGENRGGGGGDTNGASAGVTDPRIGLNARQLFLLSKNWKGISRKMEETGVNMFIRMFENNAEVYDVFKGLRHLRGLEREKQEKDESLENHAIAVMAVFDDAIGRIGEPGKFFDVLEKYGKMHAMKPGFSADFFWKMEEPFLYAVKITLDDRFTDNMGEIYAQVIKVILKALSESCSRAQGGTKVSDVAVTVS